MLALALACAAPDSDSATPWTPAAVAAPVPTVGLAEVETAIGGLLAEVREFSAAPLFTGYRTAMGAADGACPGVLAEHGNESWDAACTTGAGTGFSGYAFLHHYAGENTGDGVTVGDLITCIAEIGPLADGGAYGCHGEAWNYAIEGAGETRYETGAQGAFSFEGAAAGDTWLSGARTPAVEMIAIASDDGGRSLWADGAVGNLADPALANGYLRDVSVADPSCPTGTVSVRDAGGEWYDAAFACDPCGAVTFRGEPLGTACADFSPLVDWTDSPW
jgi:hypothetical protein